MSNLTVIIPVTTMVGKGIINKYANWCHKKNITYKAMKLQPKSSMMTIIFEGDIIAEFYNEADAVAFKLQFG